MELAKNLQMRYGTNSPILLDEIRSELKGYSNPYLFQVVREAIEKGELARFDESVYFVPEIGIFGKATINTDDVAYKKYIMSGRETIGVYAGWTFLNNIGATTQIPNTIEIITNKESAKMREVLINGRKFLLRKPKCKITEDNKKIISILETATRFTFYEDVEAAIIAYVRKNNITIKELLRYTDYYPAQTLKNIKGVLYGIA